MVTKCRQQYGDTNALHIPKATPIVAFSVMQPSAGKYVYILGMHAFQAARGIQSIQITITTWEKFGTY